jgi:hypothetical protein
MALTDNPYIGLPLVQQQQLQSIYVQVLIDAAKTGQNYAFPGLSLTRVSVREAQAILSLLRISISYTQGKIRQSAQAVIDTQNQFAEFDP